MKRMTKRLLSLVVAVVMIVTMLPASIFAAEEKELPKAEVTKLEALTLTAAEHNYMVWPSGDSSIDRPLEILVNFKALDTLEECLAGGYANWLVDFNLTFSGLANDTLIADNCYMAGNYGEFGWVVIPTDGMEISDGVTYPVVAAYDASLNYKDICKSVQNFTAALHIDQAIIDANPDLEVKLELVMTNSEDDTDKIQIGEDIIYTFKKGLPKAEVTKMEALTLTAADDYMVWPSGDDSIDRPLEIVVNFKALDTLEECLAGGYANWLVDFNLTFSGLANDTLVADNCYLAGNYGEFGWVVIPTDGMEISDGVTYPVVAAYDASLNYKDICKSVQNFTAALHIDQAIIDANPDLEVKLELVMTNPNDETDKLQIGEDMIYTFGKKVLPEAEVTKQPETTLTDYSVWEGGSNLVAGEGTLPLNAVVNFKALDTLEECLAGGYAKWLVDFNLTIEGLENGSLTIEDDMCYLAGNYGTFGWIKIPLDGMTAENGVTYPVVSNYDPTLNYKDICKSVKDFTAALYIDQEIINANPDLKITLQLIMTNPEDAADKIQIGEDIDYTFQRKVLPEAEVTKQPETTLTDYRVWEGGNNLVAGEGELPLNAVVNFKALDTLEECLAGGYAKWLVDFNLTIDGLEDGTLTIEGDKCYLAGNYGSYGWIKIPLDGMTVENGVAYPVVANYDPTLNYKDICKSVKDFTAALYIDQEIINANPDLKITLQLIMTNPEDATDKIQIGEDIIYTFEVKEIYVAQNVQTGVKYTTVQDGIDEAKAGQTVILLRNVTEAEVYVKRDRILDLNGFVLTSDDVAVHSTSYLVDNTNGKGMLVIEKDYLSVDSDNLQLPVWTDNGEVSGYRFSDVEFAQKATLTTSDRAYYRFYVKGDDAECMLANEMENGGLDNGVTVEVRMTWTDAEGNVSEKTYVFVDSDVEEYAANWTGNMFYLYINGIEELSNLTVTPTFVSRAGEEAEVIIVGETVVVK